MLAEATRREITALRDRYPHPRSAILPCLWAVQNEQGFLSTEGMAEVAEILNLAPSEVQAVSTFYSMYFDHPAGEHHVLICVNVSCALRGSDEIVSHVEQRLACPSGGTTADGKFTWESTVECLGACGGAPAMQVDHHFHEDLTAERVDAILERVRSQPGPHAAAGSSAGAPASGPHPPSAETPPVATAEGPPADDGLGAEPPAGSPPIAEHTEMPGSRTTPTANPRGSRSRPRRRPRPNADDL
ncbi:MAG TPA: NAD(P)H-dependent oxidoreductase subunit E [Candidatus Dormibacteraeota bacterium]|nr:NAD(P)H-dependent oxidoreductase subunit E [Candidatus Dormibacteraeota bacterium]